MEKADRVSTSGIVEIPLFKKLGFATMEELEGDILAKTKRQKKAFTNCGKGLTETKEGLQAIVSKGASKYDEEKALRLTRRGFSLEAELKELSTRHALNWKREECLILEKHLQALRDEIKSKKKQKKENEEGTPQVQEHVVIEVSSTGDHHDKAASEEGPSATSKAEVDKDHKGGDHERNELEYVQMKIGGTEVLAMSDSVASHNFMSEETARRLRLNLVLAGAQIKTINSPPAAILGIAEKVDTVLGEWFGKVDFTIVRIDDYEAVLGMEFMKQFEAMVVPHLRKLFIYDGREDVPIGVPTMGVTKPDHKLGGMQMEDKEKTNKRLSTMETKLAEQALVIQSLLNNILDLSRRLELVEDDDDEDDVYVRPNIQKEDREAYLRRMEVEDPDRWIELISEGEPPGSSPFRYS